MPNFVNVPRATETEHFKDVNYIFKSNSGMLLKATQIYVLGQ